MRTHANYFGSVDIKLNINLRLFVFPFLWHLHRHMFRTLARMATSPIPKRMKMNSNGPLIATHNGHFHADEALAVYMLRLLPTYTTSPLLRTRDAEKLKTAHTVVDVGGEYSPRHNRYDHHQRTFNTTFPARKTKLSSAGLVYMHFGKDIIAHRTGLKEDSAEVEMLWQKLYTDFVEALDANDNGISVYDPSETKSIQKRFNDSGINLGSLVGDLNDHYDDETEMSAEQIQDAEDQRFLSASSLMGETFLRKLQYYHKSWLPSRGVVLAAYEKRKEYDPQGRVMVFEEGVPWKDHLYTIEAENKTEGEVLYALYPSAGPGEQPWRIQAVSVSKDSFESRKALPEKWRGVRDESLSEISGIKGCVFVHASGFIGANMTKEGALEMTKKSLAT